MILRGFVINDFFIEDVDIKLDSFYDAINNMENELGHKCFMGQDYGKFFVAVRPVDESTLHKHFGYPIEDAYPWDGTC